MNTSIESLMENKIFTDEELMLAFIKTSEEIRKSQKLEKIIKEIIYDLGYGKQLPKDKQLESKFKLLSSLVEKRNITLPKKLTPITIKKEDIIDELKAMSVRDTKWINEHSYLYDTRVNGEDITKKNSTAKIMEINNFYNKVIASLDINSEYQKVKTK